MWDIAFEEAKQGGKASSKLWKDFLELLTVGETNVEHLKKVASKGIANGGSSTVRLKGVEEVCANSESCLKEATGVRLETQLVEMGENLKLQCWSKSALKSNMAMSAIFMVGELSYTLYQQWSKGDINWSQFRVQAAEIVSGHVLSGVGAWAGMGTAITIVGCCSGGPIAVAIFAMIGGVAGGAIGQWGGRKLAQKAIGMTQTDFSKENAQAVVLAMDSLNVYVDDPKDLTEQHIKMAYCPLALQMHPDKVHQKEGESDKAFQQRKTDANVRMSMLNHHYNVLKAYIEQRDTSTVWTRVQSNAAHSVHRLWADIKAKRDSRISSMVPA